MLVTYYSFYIATIIEFCIAIRASNTDESLPVKSSTRGI